MTTVKDQELLQFRLTCTESVPCPHILLKRPRTMSLLRVVMGAAGIFQKILESFGRLLNAVLDTISDAQQCHVYAEHDRHNPGRTRVSG